VFEEMRQAMPSIAGISWERINREGTVTYPCLSEDDPGQPVIFQDGFPMPDKRGKFVPAPLRYAAELPDEEYPYVFITGRQLEHWHTGAMTRRATVLDALEPLPVVSLSGADMKQLGIRQGDVVTVQSRRGTVSAFARQDDGLRHGEVFMPFAYVEAAANLLTNEALDPFGKIPEFKYCAVRVSKGGKVPPEELNMAAAGGT